MKLALDWRAWEAYGDGDAYASVPRSGAGFGRATALCIGSRQCQKARGQPGDAGVMCPSYRITQSEAHSTQGRAAVLRAALDGELSGARGTPAAGTAGVKGAAQGAAKGADHALGERVTSEHSRTVDTSGASDPMGTGAAPVPDSATDPVAAFGAAELADAMDLCVACKGCKRECPNGVDMAALRAETLAQRWRTRPVPWRTRAFAMLPHWLPRLGRWQGLIRAALRVPGLRAALARVAGLAPQRSWPLPVARPFEQRAPVASGPTASDTGSAPREAVLLVDCFSNHLEPEVAEAAEAVLQASGVVVHRVTGLCCGRPAYSAGLIDEARHRAGALVQALAPHVAAGRSIVGLEPSCLSMLRDEYAQLNLPAETATALQRQALMLEEFLARHLKPETAPFAPLPATVLVHGHCHQKAFGTLKAMRRLLGWVPGLDVQWIESSCCGMAGSFGYEREHHAASMAMAELALLPAVRAAAPDALLVASGTSCRHQIRDGAGRRPVHLAQLLRDALHGPAPAAEASASVGASASASAMAHSARVSA